jgi:hypothetical protein
MTRIVYVNGRYLPYARWRDTAAAVQLWTRRARPPDAIC